MKRFIQQHANQISGVLSGFDRMRFRGTLRWLAYTNGMQWFLNSTGILLKEFKTYVQGVTEQVREATERLVKAAGRPLIYLDSSRISKEVKSRQIAERNGIQEGLVCVFSAVEPCFSYEVRRDAQKRRLELKGRPQKCLHYYFYLQHREFGFMHLRLQTWFPLAIHIAMNGREWLARQLDAASLGYRRSDNCFLELEDPARTQELCDQQLKTRWRRSFLALLHQYHPSHKEIFREQPLEYYWTLDQSEWATDILFRSPETLGQLYPQLLRHAAYNFESTDVMRFLGRRLTSRGHLWGNFRGDVVSDVAKRLLIIPGVVALFSWPWWMLILLVMNSNMSVYVFFYRIPLLVLFCGLALFSIGRLRSEPRWRAMFTVWLLANLVAPLLGCIGPGMMVGRGIVEPLLGMVVGLGFLVPVMQDRSQGIRRDHFHYAGVACRVANVGTGIVQLLRMFLLY